MTTPVSKLDWLVIHGNNNVVVQRRSENASAGLSPVSMNRGLGETLSATNEYSSSRPWRWEQS